MRSIGRKEVEALWAELEGSKDRFFSTLLQYRTQLENLARSLDQMDLERIQIECHESARRARQLGAFALFEILMELESAAYSRDAFRVRQVRTRCEEEMIRVTGELSDFLREMQAA